MSFKAFVPESFRAGAEAAAQALRRFDNALIAAHVNLDGDALGSMAACGEIFKILGSQFALFSPSGIPRNLDFLALPGPLFESLSQIPFEPLSAVYLDCGEASRLGKELAEFADKIPSINIDHHLGGGSLGSEAKYIEPEAAATAQLVAYVAKSLSIDLQGSLADDIATGLITDTGGFAHGNTTAAVFSLCAELAANGCDFSRINECLQKSWTWNRLRLWGRLFERAQIYADGKIALCRVLLSDLAEFHCASEDLEGLADRFRSVRKVLVAGIIREERNGRCKFSLRSYGEVDVRAMSARLGGGGHLNAAGGLIEENPEVAEKILLKIIEESLENN